MVYTLNLCLCMVNNKYLDKDNTKEITNTKPRASTRIKPSALTSTTHSVSIWTKLSVSTSTKPSASPSNKLCTSTHSVQTQHQLSSCTALTPCSHSDSTPLPLCCHAVLKMQLLRCTTFELLSDWHQKESWKQLTAPLAPAWLKDEEFIWFALLSRFLYWRQGLVTCAHHKNEDGICWKELTATYSTSGATRLKSERFIEWALF